MPDERPDGGDSIGKKIRTKPRILFFSSHCYLDYSNGASIASKQLMECLARIGHDVNVLSGCVMSLPSPHHFHDWLRSSYRHLEYLPSSVLSLDARGINSLDPSTYRGNVGGVPVVISGFEDSLTREIRRADEFALLRSFDAIVHEFRPTVVAGYGGCLASQEVFRRARRMGIRTAFFLHNLQYTQSAAFDSIDKVCVPSAFAADHYRSKLGLRCTILPNPVDPARCMSTTRRPKFVTFVNPSVEKGVYPFARIAHDLGRLRPDIPFLVVEGRGNESTVAACGLDLVAGGNVSFMSNTQDPRSFWFNTRLCIMPSLCLENQPLVAIEAIMNAIPVVCSDRGGLPEVLGDSGIILPLPSRLTPTSNDLPTSGEVADWVQSIVRFWDDDAHFAEQSAKSLTESKKWDIAKIS